MMIIPIKTSTKKYERRSKTPRFVLTLVASILWFFPYKPSKERMLVEAALKTRNCFPSNVWKSRGYDCVLAEAVSKIIYDAMVLSNWYFHPDDEFRCLIDDSPDDFDINYFDHGIRQLFRFGSEFINWNEYVINNLTLGQFVQEISKRGSLDKEVMEEIIKTIDINDEP